MDLAARGANAGITASADEAIKEITCAGGEAVACYDSAATVEKCRSTIRKSPQYERRVSATLAPAKLDQASFSLFIASRDAFRERVGSPGIFG